jgi:hypothetical protein
MVWPLMKTVSLFQIELLYQWTSSKFNTLKNHVSLDNPSYLGGLELQICIDNCVMKVRVL